MDKSMRANIGGGGSPGTSGAGRRLRWRGVVAVAGLIAGLWFFHGMGAAEQDGGTPPPIVPPPGPTYGTPALPQGGVTPVPPPTGGAPVLPPPVAGTGGPAFAVEPQPIPPTQFVPGPHTAPPPTAVVPAPVPAQVAMPTPRTVPAQVVASPTPQVVVPPQQVALPPQQVALPPQVVVPPPAVPLPATPLPQVHVLEQPAQGVVHAVFQEKEPKVEVVQPKGAPEQAPAPRPVGPFEGRQRLPHLGIGPLGSTPQPTKEDLEALAKRIDGPPVDPKYVLDLVVQRARLLKLNDTPKRIQVADGSVLDYNLVTPKELTLIGKGIGTTVLNLWFADPDNKEVVISFLVRVIPNPEAKLQLERVYKHLEIEINRTFPDSRIELSLVGEKLVVRGQARDILEGTQILRIIRSNALVGADNPAKIPLNSLNLIVRPGDLTNEGGTPGLDSFLAAGGPNVINLLRVPGEQQVMLKVTVAEVNRSAARSIGLNFSVTNNQGLRVFANQTGNLQPAGQGGGAAGINGGQGVGLANIPVLLDGGQIALAINALRTLSYARTLAEPNLVAINGQTANFQAGGQFPVPVVTGATAVGLSGVQFVPFGVQLQFTPTITDRDRVKISVNATVSTRDLSSGTNIGTSFVSGLNSRTFQTTVELREGQTMAVAGLIQNNIGADTTRVPGIGDIPFLTNLTGVSKTSGGEQELVILITPELVHPMEPKEIPPLPGSDLYEPGDLEFYLKGLIESRREYDYRTTVRTDWARMRSYHRCENIYIFGPHGNEP